MMHAEQMESYRRAFEKAAAKKLEEVAARDRDRDRRKDRDAVDNDDTIVELAVFALASQEQLVAFDNRLDAYEAKIIAEMLRNDERLAEIRRQRAEMIEQAYVGPDGRRMFKSEDGLRVFDEFGSEISPDEVDPKLIPDGLVAAEVVLANYAEDGQLIERNGVLAEGLEKTALAKERAHQPGTTSEDLDAILGDVEGDMAIIFDGPHSEPQPDVPEPVHEQSLRAQVSAAPAL